MSNGIYLVKVWYPLSKPGNIYAFLRSRWLKMSILLLAEIEKKLKYYYLIEQPLLCHPQIRFNILVSCLTISLLTFTNYNFFFYSFSNTKLYTTFYMSGLEVIHLPHLGFFQQCKGWLCPHQIWWIRIIQI